MRAGHAFTTALELIANEVSEPVATEFRKLFEEQKFGMPVRDALMNLAERIPLVDVKFFVTAVMLQRETGGNLAEILDNLSYMIRERFKILRQVRVHTAQGRLTMALLMALPPVIVVVMLIMNPSFIRPLIYRPDWPRPGRRRSYAADDWLLCDSEDYSDSGLGSLVSLMLIALAIVLFLTIALVVFAFLAAAYAPLQCDRLPSALPGFSKSATAREAGFQGAVGTGPGPYQQGSAPVPDRTSLALEPG